MRRPVTDVLWNKIDKYLKIHLYFRGSQHLSGSHPNIKNHLEREIFLEAKHNSVSKSKVDMESQELSDKWLLASSEFCFDRVTKHQRIAQISHFI